MLKKDLEKRTKPWQQDEVSREVVEKLRKGERANWDEIEGDVLKAAMKPGSFQRKPKRTGLKVVPTVVEIPKELPNLPEYLREFAFRYATENRTNADWAHIFHISTLTVYKWISMPDVAGFIVKIKVERRALMAERLNTLEKKAFAKYDKILDLPVIPDGPIIEALRKTLYDIITLRQGGVSRKAGEGSLIGSISVTQNQAQAQSTETDIDVNNLTTEQIQKKLDELKTLEENL